MKKYKDKEYLQEKLDEGWTIRDIVEKFGIHPKAINSWIYKQGQLPYQQKDYLQEKLDEGWTAKEIANEQGVKPGTIKHWIQKYDLSCNRPYTERPKREFLYYLHRVKKMPVSEIADYFGCPCSTIYYWLKEYNIELDSVKESLPEYKIRKWLERENIKYEKEYTFEDCKDKYVLRFDFAVFNDIGELLLLIEYDGLQHFEAIECFGGEKAFKKIQKRDKIKDKFCDENNIRLIRINPYNSDISNICSA